MKRDFNAIAAEKFDLIVVGGGIVGAGIARDAALRGFRTLLLEKEDFAYGTTSRSSRLIHGGLRYLRRLELGFVRQDLRERETLLEIAPHLVHPQPFVMPLTSESPIQRLALPFGLWLYDFLFRSRSVPKHQRLSRRETLDLEPGLELEGLTGSFLYHDCQAAFVERICLENVLSAVEQGTVALNHARVTGLLRDGNAVSGVRVEDSVSGEVYEARARIVVNAAGHWADTMREMLGKSPRTPIRRTKGIHLLTPKLSNNAVVLVSLADARIFFVIPWQGYSMIGTTDTDYTGDLDVVTADKGDVSALLPGAQRAFPGIGEDDIFYTSAGLRALADSGQKKASDISRAHRLFDHERKDGIAGFVSVLGGKITAYRAVAEEVVDVVSRKLGSNARCSTADAPLPGAPAVPEHSVEQATRQYNLPLETVSYLAELYGSRFSQVLDVVAQDATKGQRLCPHWPAILAQVQHAVEQEGALTVGDFMLRRSIAGLGPCQGLDAAEQVADEMGQLLGWSSEERQRQVEAYRDWTAIGQRFRERGNDAPR